MKTSFEQIIASNNRQHEIANKQAELRNESKKLKQEKRGITQEFISGVMKNFIEQVSRNPNPYIYGDSSNFTKFVNRGGLELNSDHAKAMSEFTEAKENLNRVFVKSLLENKNGEQARIIEFSNLKNLKDMQYLRD